MIRESTMFPGVKLHGMDAPRQAAPIDGPGAELLALWDGWKAKRPPNCTCDAVASAMNAAGVQGCKDRRGEFIGMIEDNKKLWTWGEFIWESMRIGTLAIASGIVPSVGSMYDEAVRRAEVKEAEKKKLEQQSQLVEQNAHVAAVSAGRIAIGFKHGLGDAANFAHQLPLYQRRGWQIDVHSGHADLSPIFRAGGAEIVGSGAKHSWVQNRGRANKNWHNVSIPPMPNIGHDDALWREYLAVKLDYEPQVTSEERASVRDVLRRSKRPLIAMHVAGFTWGKHRNYHPEPTLELQRRLLDAFDCNIIVLDRDQQAPKANVAGVFNYRDFGPGHLYEVLRQSALLIAIDSGPLNFVRFTDTPAIGIWNAHYPTDFILPRALTTNVVSSQWREKARTTPAEYNTVVGDDGPSAPVLCELAAKMLQLRRDRPVHDKVTTDAYFNSVAKAIRDLRPDYDHRRALHPGDHGIVEKLSDNYLAYARLKWAVAKVIQPKSVCEMGVGGGIAALAFLDACPTAEYTGIDNGHDERRVNAPVLAHVERLMKERGCKANVVRQDTQTLSALPGRPELVHVDAGHAYPAVYHDVRLAMESGARWVLVDDASDNEVCTATFKALHDRQHGAVAWTVFEDSWTGSILIYTGERV